MSKPKVWTLPELLDRIWMLSRGRRTAVEVIDEKRIAISLAAAKCVKRVVTGWDEDYKSRTYELNKISAASAAALYERIKTMRAKGPETPPLAAARPKAPYEEALRAQYLAVPLATRNAWRSQLGLSPEEI